MAGQTPSVNGRAQLAEEFKLNSFDVARTIRRSSLDPRAKIVLEAIADRANGGNGVCWASNETLARDTGTSERQIKRVIAYLEDQKQILVIRQGTSKHSKRSIKLGPVPILDYLDFVDEKKRRRTLRNSRS